MMIEKPCQCDTCKSMRIAIYAAPLVVLAILTAAFLWSGS